LYIFMVGFSYTVQYVSKNGKNMKKQLNMTINSDMLLYKLIVPLNLTTTCISNYCLLTRVNNVYTIDIEVNYGKKTDSAWK
jgi:hypothetical protein